MARRINPVRPSVREMRAYERALREAVLDPMFQTLNAGLADASSVYHLWPTIDASLAEATTRGIPRHLIRAALERMQSYHRTRLRQTFRAALGVDVGGVLMEPAVAAFMEQRIAANVALIRTIPPRAHAGLRARLQAELAEAPFSRERVTAMLRREYKVSGYNLRRLARDQTTKTIGGLTQVRHQQLGIQGYTWQSSGDERVRPTHAENDGVLFRWSAPPSTGHPGEDILCRCVAIPVLLKADRDRLQAIAGEV